MPSSSHSSDGKDVKMRERENRRVKKRSEKNRTSAGKCTEKDGASDAICTHSDSEHLEIGQKYSADPRAEERVNAAERASGASSAELASE